MAEIETRLQYVDVRGQWLRVTIRPGDGERPPLLLLNGIGASLELLHLFVYALGESIETIRVDLPGTGESPSPIIPYRPPALAELLAVLLDRLAYPEVDVLGVSWGGFIAQQFARQYPTRCRRLVLVSTGTGAIMVPGRLSALALMLTPRRYNDPVHIAEIASKLYGGRIGENLGLLGRTKATHPVGWVGYYWQLLGITGFTSIHWLHHLQQPTLILSGSHDPIVPPINAKIMTRLIPNARLHVFDDGHLGLLTSADELAPIVRQFLVE
jgi:poly(3-hydroxyoctanoate) depolymerase